MDFKNLAKLEKWEYPSFFANHPFSQDLDLTEKKSITTLLNATITKQGFERFCKRLLMETGSEPLFLQKKVQSITKAKALNFFLKFSKPEGIRGHWDLPELKKTSSLPGWAIIRWVFPFLGSITPIWCILSVLFDLPFLPLLLLTNLLLYLSYLKYFRPLWQNVKKTEEILYGLEKAWLFLNSKERKKKNEAFQNLKALQSSASILYTPLPRLILNLLFLWDFWKWKNWKKWEFMFGEDWKVWREDWLSIEESLSFSLFYALYPYSVFPEFDEKNEFYGKSIAHPILGKDICKKNDLPQIKAGDCFIITGSNMSGKTTYMRSIALAFLLAGSGSSVFAEQLKLGKFKIFTLIRSQDSLENGISFFYSEVRRIAEIYKEVKESKIPCILFLDELLKGTNSRERTIATREIIKLFLVEKAIIFLTTHDSSLTEIEGCRNFYFTEKNKVGNLEFDYVLREGISDTTNALEILRKEGIPIPITLP